MNCDTFRQLLLFALRPDQELAPADRQAVQEHLQGCSSCAARVAWEQRFDRRLAQAIRQVAVPDGLKAKIIEQLRQRRWSAAALRTLEVAAGLALAVGLVLAAVKLVHSRHSSPPPLDLYDVASSISLARSPEAVQDWLDYAAPQPLWLPSQLRDRWNFNDVEDYYLQSLHGHQVPTLVFRKDHHRAKVLLLHRQQYDPASVASSFDPADPTRPWKVGGDGVTEYAAVAVSERGDWQTFLIRR
jgi:hypothetical protein